MTAFVRILVEATTCYAKILDELYIFIVKAVVYISNDQLVSDIKVLYDFVRLVFFFSFFF
jgi:hypothetical protein